MKVRLLHPECDLDAAARLPWQMSVLINDDLELNRLYHAMAAGDAFLLDTAKKVLPLAVVDSDVIIYRQQVLADCMANRTTVQQMYDIVTEADRGELWNNVILTRSVRILKRLMATLRQLRTTTEEYRLQFRSTGFQQLFTMLDEQLSDAYLARVDEYLNEFDLPRGALLSARLGLGNRSEDHVLHQPPQHSRWAKLTANHSNGGGFVVDNDDLDGTQALMKLAGRAVNEVANTITQSAEHLQSFLGQLRMELGFYLGCLNLHDQLAKHQVVMCFPVPTPSGTQRFESRGLRDVGLCLTTSKKIRGNDVDANGKALIVITGANDGGKSTLLRSVGTAQLMMQAGMFVTAEAFSADIRAGIFTHFTREEDGTLQRGKLEEELARMSEIVDSMGPTSLLLCNESFASTNELEGSEIARDIVHGMVSSGVKVFFVTHLYDFAHSLHANHDAAHLFLRAERHPGGERTFRLNPGEPVSTSHGKDSFRRIFGVTGPAGAERETSE